MNHWHYRYRDTYDIAVAIRVPHGIPHTSDFIEQWRQKGLIRNEPVYYDCSLGRDDGWNLLLAFNLCPCFDIYYSDEAKASHLWLRKDDLEWKQVIA
jgi:hypothetical protein